MNLQIIQDRIYEIRNVKVMLDFDLAEMYQVETRVLNQAVKRNIKRFPPDFMFQLTDEEFENFLISQFVISKIILPKRGGTRKLPYAFTEQGVSMLSGLLKSDIAIAVNVSIMRAFVVMRQALASTSVIRVKELQEDITKLQQYMEDIFADQNAINEDTRMQLDAINDILAELQAGNNQLKNPRKRIGYTAEQYKSE